MTERLMGRGAGGAVAIWSFMLPTPPAPRPISRSVLGVPPDQQLVLGPLSSIALSPDGTRLVYAAQEGEATRLYLRALDQFEARPVPGTEGATSPFFSPDGEWVGFFAAGTAGELQKVSVAGGAPQTISDVPAVNAGASWGPDDTIVFATAFTTTGLFRVSADGGTPEALTTPDVEAGETEHLWPHVLPDGKSVLFTVRTTVGMGTAVLSLDTRDWHTVLPGIGAARYLPTGHVVYA